MNLSHIIEHKHLIEIGTPKNILETSWDSVVYLESDFLKYSTLKQQRRGVSPVVIYTYPDNIDAFLDPQKVIGLVRINDPCVIQTVVGRLMGHLQKHLITCLVFHLSTEIVPSHHWLRLVIELQIRGYYPYNLDDLENGPIDPQMILNVNHLDLVFTHIKIEHAKQRLYEQQP
jgi:hypothetical protein